jgi:4-amino-4-deoxy-L-arabinose transferase-like glycosyltransferase
VEKLKNTWHWQAASGKFMLLSTIFLCSLGIRVYLLGERWIDPDEGAHLMDAMLVLEGKIPLVDFNSRQPVYVLVNALVLNMFGVNLTAGRMLPLVCSLLTGVVIFFIARRVFNENAAILSTIIFWLLPLEVLYSVSVRTEPMNMLIICCSVFFMIRSFQSGSAAGWWISGALAAVAFYVRQSALVVPFIMLVTFPFLLSRRKATMLREMLMFFGGFAVVVLLVLIYYSRYFTWRELLSDNLNPLGFLLKSMLKTMGETGEAAKDAVLGQQASEHGGGETGLYVHYVISAIILHLFLFVGLGLSIIQLGKKFLLSQRNQAEPLSGTWILYLWFFGLVIAYIYYFLTRGFFIEYIREVMPPLVILFSGWAVNMFSWGNGPNRWIKLLCIALLPAVAVFFLTSAYPGFSKALQLLVVCLCTFAAWLIGEAQTPGAKPRLAALSAAVLVIGFGLFYFRLSKTVSWTASAAMLAIAYGSGWKAVRVSCKIDAGAWWRAVCLSVIVGSLSLSISHSVSILDRRYNSIWSPQSLREVAALISSHSGDDEQVMSGGVIWEFTAGRRPFLMISHPLVYKDRMQEKDKQFVGKALRDFPPKIIVQDGYTEKTYFQYFPWIGGFLEQRYRVIHTARLARYPVTVYLRIDG